MGRKICEIDRCENKIHGHGYCSKHYWRWKRHGDPLFNKYNTEGNKFEHLKNGTTKIFLTQNQVSIIDTKDFNLVKDYIWCAHWGKNTKSYYAVSKINGQSVRMHRLIMNAPKTKVVDHIDHYTLNNTKDNLRICTKQQNNMNQRKSSNNTSGVTGVCWDKRYNKWAARINIDKKQTFIGYFANKQDAIKARKKAEKKYFKEFAYKED